MADYQRLLGRPVTRPTSQSLIVHHAISTVDNVLETFSGLAVGIYTTHSAKACQYVARSAACNIIVVENDTQLQKILSVRQQLPHLKAIIQYVGVPKEHYPNVYSV